MGRESTELHTDIQVDNSTDLDDNVSLNETVSILEDFLEMDISSSSQPTITHENLERLVSNTHTESESVVVERENSHNVGDRAPHVESVLHTESTIMMDRIMAQMTEHHAQSVDM